MALPRVSIIIATWNALPLLKQCLPSVVATRYEALEIILVDNGSTDGTAAWVQDTFPEVRVLRLEENLGFAGGNNRGMAMATGEYLVLLNNDVEVSPDWLHPLVEAMEAHPDLGAVQPKLLQYDDRHRFEYAGAAGGFVDRDGFPFTRGRLFFTLEEDRGQYDDPVYVFWATGAALMLRRKALDRVGLLDEQFFMHMEEIDLCWRLQRAGYRIAVVPSSRVYHIGGASLPQHHPRKTYFNYRNNLLTLYKNLTPGAWRRTLLRRLLLDGAALLRLLVTGAWKEAGAMVKAYRDAHRMKTLYTPAETTVLPPYPKSVVLDYFLRGRRHFADLPREAFRPPYGQPLQATSPVPAPAE